LIPAGVLGLHCGIGEEGIGTVDRPREVVDNRDALGVNRGGLDDTVKGVSGPRLDGLDPHLRDRRRCVDFTLRRARTIWVVAVVEAVLVVVGRIAALARVIALARRRPMDRHIATADGQQPNNAG